MLNLPCALLAAAAAGHGEEHEQTLGDVVMHHISNSAMGVPLLDEWGVSKAVVMMMIASLSLIALMSFALRRSRISGRAPKGLTNGVEFVVLYVRDQIAFPAMGERYGRAFTPYLCTLFFFILFCNVLGLFPGGYAATSNLNVTVTLALLTLLLIVAAGVFELGPLGYLKHFVPPGTPLAVAPMVFLIEVISLFVKPIALTIRLGANMTAGHIVILVMLGFIFVFKSFWVVPISILMALAITMLELIVALIQAYVFTLLTSVFIGMVVHESH